MRILFDINLPVTSADWVSEISVGRQIINCWHKTFEMILYSTLHRIIGHSYVILVGFSIFGIIQMLVMFNLESISPQTKILFTISTKSFLIICQECWKNIAIIPFCFGAFYGCIINKIWRTSSSVAILNNLWFIWKVIHDVNSVRKLSNSDGEMMLNKYSKLNEKIHISTKQLYDTNKYS